MHADQFRPYRGDCLQADVLISKPGQDHPPVQSAWEVRLWAAQQDRSMVEPPAPLAPAQEILCSGKSRDQGWAADQLPDRMRKPLCRLGPETGGETAPACSWCKHPRTCRSGSAGWCRPQPAGSAGRSWSIRRRPGAAVANTAASGWRSAIYLRIRILLPIKMATISRTARPLPLFTAHALPHPPRIRLGQRHGAHSPPLPAAATGGSCHRPQSGMEAGPDPSARQGQRSVLLPVPLH